ncbi:MAG: low temperature requirement [Cyanobacteria bacterium RYN_339]|nr:low temperature requirement [Cyanobacteria bacterium RYN_339]
MATAERRATWLELFYDLVFVIAVSKVAAHLEHEVGWASFGAFAGLFVVVWWARSVYSAFNSRFELDDRFHRLVTLAQMLAAAALAVQVAHVPGEGEVGFVAAYLGVRATLLLLYGRAYQRFPDSRRLLAQLMAGYAFTGGLWAASLLLPAPWRYGLWALGLAVDISTPLACRAGLRRVPADTAHLPERFGLFTLIVLGEAILAVVASVDRAGWNPAGDVAALLGFGMAASVWWAYYNYVERAPLQCSLGNGQAYIYLHLPLVGGLTMAGAGVGHAIREAGGAALPLPTVLLVVGGMALWLGAFLAIQIVTYPPSLARLLWRGYGPALLAVALLALVGPYVPPLAFLIGMLACVAALAAMDVRWRVALPARAYAVPEADPRDQETVRKLYRAPDVDVSFDPALCIHSGECLRRLPDVFALGQRPWVRPDRAGAAEVIAAVQHCPSGALRIERRPAELAEATSHAPAGGATIELVAGGPAYVHDPAGVRLDGVDEPATTVALCRCGKSQRFPYCDGSHART